LYLIDTFLLSKKSNTTVTDGGIFSGMDTEEIQTHLEVNGLALEDVPSVEEQERVKEFSQSIPELRRGKKTGLLRDRKSNPSINQDE
jgi:hypothetical protein